MAAPQALLEAYRVEEEEKFLSEMKAALSSGFQEARLALASVKASVSSGVFALRCLLRLLQLNEVEAWSPQAASLLADFGPGLNDGLEEAQVLFGKLASLESGGLKSLTRCLRAWSIQQADQLTMEVRNLLVAAVMRDVAVPQRALAAVSLGALPLLLPMEESKTVLRVADDGTHDEATEVMVKGLAKDVKYFLVSLRYENGRLRSAAKAVQALGLENEFPDAEFLWKREALEAAIHKGRKEAIVGLSCQEPRLHSRCVHGLLECHEVELAVDLAAAWNITIADVTQQLRDAKVKREAECLCLPATITVMLLEQEAKVESMASLLSADAIGFDLECDVSNGEPTLLQIASVREIFLVDLLAIGHLPALANMLQEVWSSKMPKVGFGGAEDIGKLSRGFPNLGKISSNVVDLRDIEAKRRAAELDISKKKAAQGISLSSLAEKYLGKPLDKTFQVGDWSRRPISEARAQYAALDAWVPVKVFELIEAPNRGYPENKNAS